MERLIREDSRDLPKEEAYYKEETKKLTGEKFFEERKFFEDSILQFRELLYDYQEQLKAAQGLERELLSESMLALEKEPDAEFLKIPSGVMKKIKEGPGIINPYDRERVRVVIENLNDFGKKYNLDFEVSVKTDPDKILAEIEKAYYARMWQLQSRLE